MVTARPAAAAATLRQCRPSSGRPSSGALPPGPPIDTPASVCAWVCMGPVLHELVLLTWGSGGAQARKAAGPAPASTRPPPPPPVVGGSTTGRRSGRSGRRKPAGYGRARPARWPLTCLARAAPPLGCWPGVRAQQTFFRRLVAALSPPCRCLSLRSHGADCGFPTCCDRSAG